MAIDFANVWDTLKNGVINIAETELKDFVASAKADGQAILNDLKADLQTWTLQLASGALSKPDFEDLVLGQKEQIEMVALKEAGIAEIEADKFKNDVLDLVVTTVTSLI